MKRATDSWRLRAAAWTILLGGAIACAGSTRTGDVRMPDGTPGAPVPQGPSAPTDDPLTNDSVHADRPAFGAADAPPHVHAPTPPAPRPVSPPSGPTPRGHQHAPAPAPSAPVSETTIGADGRLTIAAPVWTGLSQRAQEQIGAVERAVAHLDTPAKARAAGFRPALGMIPTMGVHWVNAARMTSTVELERPAHLMFSRVNGEDRLMGVAFAFIGKSAREAPDLFDGPHDVWHEHPEFAPEGQTLVMLHVWFVPSPHGAFAGHNPWLPYWAAGLQPPPAATLENASSARRVHRLALALAEHAEPMQFARYLELDAEVRAGIERRRAAIGAIIPRLNAARRAGDQAAWNRDADAAIAEWQVVRDAYLAAVPQPRARELLAELYAQMERGHAH